MLLNVAYMRYDIKKYPVLDVILHIFITSPVRSSLSEKTVESMQTGDSPFLRLHLYMVDSFLSKVEPWFKDISHPKITWVITKPRFGTPPI